MAKTVEQLTEEQAEAVSNLVNALDYLGNALISCRNLGLEPAAAFSAAGIQIPSFASPMLNMMFKDNGATVADAVAVAGNQDTLA